MRILNIILALAMAVGLSACSTKFRTYNGPDVTQIQIFKEKRVMYLIGNGEVLKTYKIALGGNPLGHKQFEGDQKTPEGAYFIDRKNPKSSFHLSLGISYPNEADRAFAKEQDKKPGGDIFIHGRAGANKGRGKDWTAGCISVTDRQAEEIYSMVRTGTSIIIFP